MTYTGICTHDRAKVWSTPGGSQIDDLRKGEQVIGDLKTFYGATEYMRLTSHGRGWTKIEWLSVHEEPEHEPEPEPEPTPLPGVVLYRVPHDPELTTPGPSARFPDRVYIGKAGHVRDTKGKTIPETFRMFPDHQTPLDCTWQRLIRDINPEHGDDVVDRVLDQAWVLCNNTGLGAVGRKNCRTGKYMNDRTAKWPAFHTPIICGGALLKGSEVNANLLIQGMIASNPAPSAEFVLARPWLWFFLTEINSRGVVTFMTLTAKDGTRKPVRVPIVSSRPLYCPLTWLHKLPAGLMPGATWRPE